MEALNFSDPMDAAVRTALDWVTDHGGWLFDGIDDGLSAIYDGLEWLLLMPSLWIVVAIAALLGWIASGPILALLAALGFLACAVMGLWEETMSTLTLVLSSVAIALLIAIPIGIISGLKKRLQAKVDVVMDVVQTIPPYIYLLPAVALVGYGPSTAMAATIVVSIPPALRLTALGIRLTPKELVELGRSSGATPLQMLWKIRLPVARRSIMTGVNQSLMVGVGMVVIAGIVGSGGLGFTIYEAIRTLDIGLAIDGGIAIVILTMVIDRISQGLGERDLQGAQA